ncbi:MAG: NUDIX domain-containing protein [Anaerolineae bacterium]|nr:NUDIX domain-containing protein [Anaerolineae bacterium]
MHGLTVQVAIFSENKVLLIQREDYEVWALPGGAIDPGESPAVAAIREAKEETGLEIRLTRLVGLYTKTKWHNPNMTTVLFAAEIVSGEIRADSFETLDIGFFDVDALPEPIIWWARNQILDAANGIGGSVVRTQQIASPLGDLPTRQELYDMRDASDLSRAEFFREVFPEGPETVEVPGRKVTD